jgi:hypothetical protein
MNKRYIVRLSDEERQVCEEAIQGHSLLQSRSARLIADQCCK